MTRDELIEKICPYDNTSECRYNIESCSFGCDDCMVTLGYMFDEYDKQIRTDAIDECISKIDTLEQISFGIVEVDLIKSLLEQLKEKM